MKKWLSRIFISLIILIIVVVVAGLTFSVTIASPVDFKYSAISITNSEAVQISQNEKDFKDAKKNQKLSTKDGVKTAEGTTSIILPDGSEIRLDKNTEITITDLNVNSKNKLLEARFELKSGRVWVQAANLVNDDSYIQIESKDAVAKATGTAFAMEILDSKTNIYAVQHKVAVGSKKIIEGETKYYAQLKIEPGNVVSFDPASLPETIADIDPVKIDEITNASDWFITNKNLTADFQKSQKDKLENRVAGGAGISASNPLYIFKLLGEQILKTFIFSDQEMFDLDYKLTDRRLLEALRIASTNKELAFKLMNEFNDSFLNLLNNSKEENLDKLATEIFYNQDMLQLLSEKMPDYLSDIYSLRVAQFEALKKDYDGNKQKITHLTEKLQDLASDLILEYKDTPSWLAPEDMQIYRKYIEYGAVSMFDIKPNKVTTPKAISAPSAPKDAQETATITPVATYAPIDHISVSISNLPCTVPCTLAPFVIGYDAQGNAIPVDQSAVTYNISLTISNSGTQTLTATYQDKTASVDFNALPGAPTEPPTSVPTTEAPPPSTTAPTEVPTTP